jgi:hypothetical protein
MEHIIVQLAEQKRLVFRGARDVHIECTDGLIGITIKGRLDDFVIVKGERLLVERNDMAVIQGLPSGSIQIHYMATVSVYQGTHTSLYYLH